MLIIFNDLSRLLQEDPELNISRYGKAFLKFFAGFNDINSQHMG